MITPRTTRLLRAPDLHAFRDTLVALASEGSPLDARDRLVVVPTRAAATHLLRSIENRLAGERSALLLPDLITPGELTMHLALRLPPDSPVLSDAEREVLLGVACRAAAHGGDEPPFRLRPGLVAEVLRFFDTLLHNQRDIDAFERLALGALEPGAAIDRGAERLVRQTRFLVSAFRHFERLCQESGATDGHRLRARVLAEVAGKPWRHLVIAASDRAWDPHGLWPADWDTVARVPGVERVDVVVTDTVLAGAFHERIHQLLPGIEEVRVDADPNHATPTLCVPPGAGIAHRVRDREDEVAWFARWVRRSVRIGAVTTLDRTALVVRQPLPYVYLARAVLRSASVGCQMFDALPLAAEPYAAALDLVLSFASTNFSRAASVALLRSPHFDFGALSPREVTDLNRALSEQGYLGDYDTLSRLADAWSGGLPGRGVAARAARAATLACTLAQELLTLREAAPVADHLSTITAFLRSHEHLPGPDDPLRVRQLRARAAILGTLDTLRVGYGRWDPTPASLDEVAGTVRRWIDGQTFAPRTGESGVHLVDADSARFGDFDHVHLAGLVDGEWPERPRRNIFYAPAILRELGWPAESDRLAGERAAFADLLHLPSSRLAVSAFTLEEDTLVAPSMLLDEVERAELLSEEYSADATRVFDYEALGIEPVQSDALGPAVRAAADLRLRAPTRSDPRFHGVTAGHAPPAHSLSALERYQDCPFKFFAADVLRLEEAPEDEPAISPRARGRFVHEVFQRFFETWDATAGGTITSATLDEARALFQDVAAPMLETLPEADAGLERTRLFGSAIAVGMVDVVLGLEAARSAVVVDRWLEHRFDGAFSLGADGREVRLKGVADRVDLLAGNRLRVIDYKSGAASDAKRALQVPVYSLCAIETLAARDGHAWTVEEAAYVAFSARRALVPVIKAGATDTADVLAGARARLFAAVDGVSAGIFPPRPHDTRICGYCAYASVCRKDYVGDE